MKVTSIVVAEKGKNTITRYGIEEYIADCVIFLDRRIIHQISIRRLIIIKYRGSAHGANEYPFLITENGVYIYPISSMTLDYYSSKQRISSGIERLDKMLGGKGFYKGSSVLITGSAGVGKTSVLASFVENICKSGKKCIFFTFEESETQIIRNMKSININLEKWIKADNLIIHSSFPYSRGLESHLLNMINLMNKFKPYAIVVDPITNLRSISSELNVKLMFTRLVNYLKSNQITSLFTSLIAEDNISKTTESISSIMDAWILLKYVEYEGERNRVITILKSRGMPHSKQTREFILTNDGIQFENIYVGSGKVLTGSAKIQQEMQRNMEIMEKRFQYNRKLDELDIKKKQIESDVLALKDTHKKILHELQHLEQDQNVSQHLIEIGRKRMSKLKMADIPLPLITSGKKRGSKSKTKQNLKNKR